MCTLIVLDRVVPGRPLLIGANRDEQLARPAAPPARVDPEGGTAFVAPQDLEAGGTWMGLNAAGLFVGLTNRPDPRSRPGTCSRGLLVMDSLVKGSAAQAAAAIGADLEDLPGRYNPFHLFLGDGRDSFLVVLDADGARTTTLEPGAHVIGNRDVDDPASGKVAAVRERVARLDLEGPFETLFDGLANILRSHGTDGSALESTCVHTPEYGTRSSAIWSVSPRRKRLWFADGAPCETKYRNLSSLLDSLPDTN